jgi:anti-sigma regulatory factor (Ser/Thr protein kinase)
VPYLAAGLSAGETVIAIASNAHLRAAPEPTLPDGQIASRQLTGEFSSRPDAPGRARRLVVAALRRWGIDDTLVHDAALVLSELANNAVIHARSSFSIEVCAQESALRIAVADTRPRPRARVGADGSLIPRRGHGLGVIEALSGEWGVEDRLNGKVVWAELRGA